MKKLFGNRAFVIIVSAVLIIGSTILSVRAKLGGKADDVTELFYSEAFNSRSPASLLQEIGTQCALLSAIGSDYGLDVEDFSWQIDALDMAVRYSRGEESYIFDEYSELIKSCQNLRRLLDGVPLSETDRAQAQRAAAVIDEDMAQISAITSEYNDFVRSFNRRYGNPLAVLMARIAGVEMPEEFK